MYALAYARRPGPSVAEHRRHRAFLRKLQERGVNLASGPLGDDGALVVAAGGAGAVSAGPGGPLVVHGAGNRARGPRVTMTMER
ncbi:hypothetical protein QJS66_07450 [Kocuria rhizophila]|nr:hypothetical protein QJS66_07450 [Kocuria rhizophila]